MKIIRSKQAKYPTLLKFAFAGEIGDVPDFKAKDGEVAVRYEQGFTVVYCGLGKREAMAPHKARTAAANGIRTVRKLERMGLSVILPQEVENKPDVELACVEGLYLGAYEYTEYKSEKPKQLRTCQLVGATAPTKKINDIIAACQAACYTRDLVNDNADAIFPERLADEARQICRQEGFTVTVLTEIMMEKKGLGLIHAVGRGADRPPRLIIMQYKGAPDKPEKTAIVGKGITFDSGGQNLKPSGSIETMRDDMSGAGAVLGVMKALAEIKPAINVIGVLAAAHNAIGAKAFFPGDVYKSYLGKTVEIGNTDAEGRLVLADAVAYCEKNYHPTEIIDVATLTGGILIALGTTVAGLFTKDDAMADRLFAAGEDTRERLWRFPLYQEFYDAMKSDRADLCNTAKLKKGYASALTGAAFIGEFVTETPWAHLDIAGTAYNDGSPKGETPQFGTGFGVRLMLKYLGVI
ncbi:MAG: leucyl aminopeptidase [Desulfatibacillum sp.]|nr:leucyl aminopeptidase [Desulfatibacillum sp.]